MKKNYLFSLLAIAFAFCTANAQFTDNFESYPLGPYHGGNWSSWSGTAGDEDIIVTSNFAFDGTKSGLIGGGTIQDAMLLLGNKTSGVYQLNFQVYIPTNKSGYMNFQGTTTASGGGSGGGVFNSPNLIFNNVQSATGAPGLGGAYQTLDSATPTYTWQYPESAWFPVNITFDIDNGLWTMSINGTALAPQPFDEELVLGAIDLFSFDPNNEMYIDAITYSDALSVNEEALNSFKAYPNPVVDYLYLSTPSKVDLVEVYDILGKNVISINPAIVSPKIDMRNLSSGAYIVRVSIGDQSKTMKIIK